MTTCTSCQSWQLKSSPMDRQGFASCANLPRWEYWPPQHACNRHIALSQEATDKRILFLGGMGKHNKGTT